MEKKRPQLKLTKFGVHLAVFKSNGKGKTPFYSIDINRPYKDTNNNWQRGTSFTREQLDILIAQVQEAAAYIDEQAAADSETLEEANQ